MEYIYLEQSTKEPVKLEHFRGLSYSYDAAWSDLTITDSNNNSVAQFTVQPEECYLLQRRNQSALQLHKVTPPKFCMDEVIWLFGFGSKHRRDSIEAVDQACEEYQAAHRNAQVVIREVDNHGLYMKFAFTRRDNNITPIAHYYRIPSGTAWALSQKDIMYYAVYEMHGALSKFQYPLQYVIHCFRGSTMSYPVETRDFFRNKLYIRDNDVYYADLPGDF